jgi:hypothetical protein
MDADLIEGLVGRSVLIFDQPCRSRRIRVLDLDPIGRERTRKVSHKASISSLHYPDGDIRAAAPGCDCSPALTASVRVVRWRASTASAAARILNVDQFPDTVTLAWFEQHHVCKRCGSTASVCSKNAVYNPAYWCSLNAPFVRLKMLTAEGP